MAEDSSQEKTELPTARRLEKHVRMAMLPVLKSFQWQ